MSIPTADSCIAPVRRIHRGLPAAPTAQLLLLIVAVGLTLILAACGGSSANDSDPFEGLSVDASGEYSVRVLILRVDTADDVPVSIQIELPNGSRIDAKLGPAINPADWDSAHLEGHRANGFAVLAKLTAVGDEFMVVNLSE